MFFVTPPLLLVASLLLVVRPGAPSSVLAPSNLVAMPLLLVVSLLPGAQLFEAHQGDLQQEPEGLEEMRLTRGVRVVRVWRWLWGEYRVVDFPDCNSLISSVFLFALTPPSGSRGRYE